MSEIKLNNRTKSVVTTETFELEVDGKKLIYIDYINEDGKVIDSDLQDENGNRLTDDMGPDNNAAETMGRIQDYLDALDTQVKSLGAK